MPLTVYEFPASIPVGAADHDKMHEEGGQRFGGAGTYSPPPPLGSGSDDRQRLVDWLATSPANCTVSLQEGYLVGAPLVVPSGRRYLGRGYAEQSNGHITLRNGANPADAVTAVVVPAEWDQNVATGAAPTMFENLSINGNSANNTGTYGCLLLYHYWSRVLGCRFDSPRLDHVRLTPRSKNSTLSSISHADNWIYNNRMRLGLAGTDGAGIRLIRPAGQPATNADVRCLHNHGESLQHGIWLDDGAGWTIFDNHLFCQRNGINVDDGWYGLTVLANYIDSFGVENAAGPFYGIRLKGWGGATRLPACHANQVSGPDPIPASATNRYWYWINGGADGAAMNAIGNRALGPFNNPSAKAHGFTWDASSGTFHLTEGYNLALWFNAGQDREVPGAGAIAYKAPVLFTGTATWNPGAVTAGTISTVAVTVPGAAVGDTAEVGWTPALAALTSWRLWWAVTAANTVTVAFENRSGGSITPASTTVRATVTKYNG